MMQDGALNIPLIAGGLAIGLFGWVLYWAGIPLIGGLVGACAGAALGIFASDLLKQASWTLPLFIGIGIVLGGILGVLLMRALQLYFFFAAGASIGGTLTWRLLQQESVHRFAASTPGWGVMLAVIVGAVIGGLILVKFRRFIIAVVTSVIGTVMLAAGLPPQFQLMGALIALVVFMSVQIGLVRRFVEEEAFDRRMQRYRLEGPAANPDD